MGKQSPVSPRLSVQALHDALLAEGVEPGQTFEGDQWEDIVIVAFDVQDPRVIRNWTRVGKAHGLWDVESGSGRGHRTKVTIRAAN